MRQTGGNHSLNTTLLDLCRERDLPLISNEGQLEDLLDFLMFLNPDSGPKLEILKWVIRHLVLKNYERFLNQWRLSCWFDERFGKNFSGRFLSPLDNKSLQIWKLGRDMCTVNDCISKGGAVILSYRHKGSIDPGNTHIVSLQRAEHSCLILDDPYGISRVGYLRQKNVTAYHGSVADSRKYCNTYRNSSKNAISSWRISNRRNPNDNEVRGRDSIIMLKETVYNPLYYLRFIWGLGLARTMQIRGEKMIPSMSVVCSSSEASSFAPAVGEIVAEMITSIENSLSTSSNPDLEYADTSWDGSSVWTCINRRTELQDT